MDNHSSFKKDTYYWFLEPLSGKENFKRSIPIFSSSISVVYNDKVIASSIYDPLRNDFYFTEEGKGAFLNDRRIRVSNRKYLENSLISLQINNSNLEIDNIAVRHIAGQELFLYMGSYAPAFGMLGTVLGLIVMILFFTCIIFWY